MSSKQSEIGRTMLATVGSAEYGGPGSSYLKQLVNKNQKEPIIRATKSNCSYYCDVLINSAYSYKFMHYKFSLQLKDYVFSALVRPSFVFLHVRSTLHQCSTNYCARQNIYF